MNITEEITLTKTPGVDERSGYSYVHTDITPTLSLRHLIIDGQHYNEVQLSCTVGYLIKAAEIETPIPGQPSDTTQFPPPPRTRELIIKDAGLEENPEQLRALQDLYQKLGPEGLVQAVETIGNLNEWERARFLNDDTTE